MLISQLGDVSGGEAVGHHVACAGVLVGLPGVLLLHQRHQLYPLTAGQVGVLHLLLHLELLDPSLDLVSLAVFGVLASLPGVR